MYENNKWNNLAHTACESMKQDIEIRQMIMEGNIKEFTTNNGDNIIVGKWYYSRRGHLFLVYELCESGYIIAIAHISGNKIKISPEQLYHAMPADVPKIPPGMLLSSELDNKKLKQKNNRTATHQHLYEKYSHIVIGSVYSIRKTGSKSSKKSKSTHKGEMRCKIICQENKCNNERDIKVQDAFQVKRCKDCQKKHSRKRKR